MQRLAPLSVLSAAVLFSSSAAQAQNADWMRQLGTAAIDSVRAVTSSGGGVWACGYSYGALSGSSVGLADAIVARYSDDGVLAWTRQFGTPVNDFALAASADGGGGLFAGGFTSGVMSGVNLGFDDAWLARLDAAGAIVWTRQLGSDGYDTTFALSADAAGGVFAGGQASGALGAMPHNGADDAWLARFDASGATAWLWQGGGFGDDTLRALSTDAGGGCFAGGATSSSAFGANAGGTDAWIARFDSAGAMSWSVQLGGAGLDALEGLTSDGAGGVFAVGQTHNSLASPNAGGADAWIARFNAAGALLWMRQFGSPNDDLALCAAPGVLGAAYIGGKTRGALEGAYVGGWDSWVASIDSSGALAWIDQFGVAFDDETSALCSDGLGGAYAGGLAFGALGGAHAGSFDAWCARYETGCVGGVNYCTGGTSALGCSPTLTGSGVASAGASSNFVLTASDLEGQRAGLIFYGVDNTGFTPLVWAAGSSSFMCVKSPVQRSAVQSSGGAIGQCNGQFVFAWSAFVTANPGALGAPFSAGDEVFAQAWFRDPPAPKSTGLSNGLRFRLCP